MGTNFYVRTPACPECGRGGEDIHLGKSSFGWKFLFAPLERMNGEGIYSWRRWKEYLAGKCIVDDSGMLWDLADFEDLVESRQASGKCADTASKDEYGPYSAEERSRFERKDADGYRFATTADFS